MVFTKRFRVRDGWLLIFVVGLTLCGQSGEAASFEVASIRPAAPGRGGGLRVDGDRITISNASLKNLVWMAYSVKPYQVLNVDGGERFDIAAVLPAGATRSDVPAFLRSLLADRFKLSAHVETKKSAGYALVVGKGGHKMQAVPPGTEPVIDNRAGTGGRVKVEFVSTMATIAEKVLGGISDRPIADKTGLSGLYSGALDIELRSFVSGLLGDVLGPAAAANPQIEPSYDILSDASRQLGLRIENVELPEDMIVVDHVESLPTEN